MDTDLVWQKDTKGDRNNLQYGCLEKATIPKYRTAGRGHIIGLSRSFKISSSRRQVIATGLDIGIRTHSLETKLPSKRIHIRGERDGDLEDELEEQSSYISLKGRPSRTTSSGADDERFRHPDDSDASSSSEDADPVLGESNEAFSDEDVHARQRALMKATTDEPQSVRAWMDLIQHQVFIVRGTDSTTRKLTGKQQQTMTSMRIAIYEQALAKVKQPEDRNTLIAGLMREGGRVWDHKKQLSRWQSILDQDPSFELRLLYLAFFMGNSNDFSYEKILVSIADCLRALRREPNGKPTDERFILLISRATSFMRQAGYQELAWAIWQANLEVVFFQQHGVGDPAARFEDFWDRECARICETGALGWAKSSEADPVQGMASTVALDIAEAGEAAPATWAAAERNVTKNHIVSARTTDDTDDPYQTVLFNDVQGYLHYSLTRESKPQLLNAFLLFCHLPSYSDGDFASRNTRHGHSDDLATVQTSDNITLNTVCRPSDSIALFADGSDLYSVFNDETQGSASAKYAAAALRLLISADPSNEDLSEYTLALESKLDPTASRKLAKKMLKQRESPRLYNAYATMQAQSSGLPPAEKIWMAILKTQLGSTNERHARLTVLRSWAWQCTKDNKSDRAVQVVASAHLAEPHLETAQDVSTAQLQRAEDFLWSSLSRVHSQTMLNELVVIVDLLALLRYHSANRDLAAALQVHEQCLALSTFQTTSSKLPDESNTTLEQLHINRNRLIAAHTSSTGVQFRPKQLISLLRASCTTFPQNLAFRTHYHVFMQQHGGIDRLRAGVLNASSSTDEPTLIDHLASINAAMSLPTYQGGTQHVIRAAFQHALLPFCEQDEANVVIMATTNVHSCPAINIAYLKWEMELLRSLPVGTVAPASDRKAAKAASSKRDHRARKRQVQNVKAAFQTAVSNCPWVKEIYLLYFDKALEGDIEKAEWDEVYESMLERGLRIRIERSA